ncbi:hypothetical protein [Streptomyces sp. ODS28]|uniref:hypothetical protein n=1 Tax=Streptomyces sp. ODS28 TaxID=3136688 RepID=UPI0031EF0D69
MNTAGTIDHPATHGPVPRHLPKQDLAMAQPTSENLNTYGADGRSRTAASGTRQNRTRQMQLMPETMARAHMRQRLRDAEAENRALRLASARRLQRKAERATLRARRALAMAVMQ